jgi:hypothetical protein
MCHHWPIMSVEGLLEILKEMPPDARVVRGDSQTEPEDIGRVYLLDGFVVIE